jgi:hypothetical protein
MPSSHLLAARPGFSSARRSARRAWLILTVVALIPGWAAVDIIPEFFTVDKVMPLSDGAPNLWAIVQTLPWIGDLPLVGLAATMAIGAAAFLAAHFSARPPRGEALLRAALLVALVLPGLLPRMQPQDFVSAVVLSSALAVRQRNAAIAALVIGGWLAAVFVSTALGAAPVIVASLWIARPFFASPANDDGPPFNPMADFPPIDAFARS